MRINLKMVCFVSVLFLIAGGFSTPVLAMNDIRYSSYHNMTAEEIQRIVDETTGTQIENFDSLLETNPNVLSAYGVIPEVAKGVEAYEYWMQMGNISRSLANDEFVQNYLYENGGLIIGLGTQCICYISIIVLEEQAGEFTEEDMLAVKDRVDYYASLEGFEDVPMVFFKGAMAESYLTEEQLLYLYDSGYKGLTINDGLENLTDSRSEFGVVSMSAGSYAFDNEGLSGTPSALDNILAMFQSMFGGSADAVDLSVRKNLNGLATEKVRPVVGGLMMATSTSGGTVGYAARDVNNPNLRGIVTVAHVFHFENATSYQPRQVSRNGNEIGLFSKMSKGGDSVFIPMNASDIKPAIYTGEGDDQLLEVIGYEGAISNGMPLSKSGAVSGNTEGTYNGVRYNQTFTIKNGTINYTVNHVGVIQEASAESCSVPGDSGGPVYVKTKAVVNGTEQDVAVLLGILEGGDGNGTVFYVPCTEIQENLGVIPLTINDR